MVELHLSLRCSEYFATTATLRVQAGAATTLIVVGRIFQHLLFGK